MEGRDMGWVALAVAVVGFLFVFGLVFAKD